MDKIKKKRRKKYLSKKVQIKYAVIIFTVLLLLLAITQLYTLKTLNEILPYILSDRIGLEIRMLQTHLLVFGFFYAVAVAVLSIYVTHKMAGPVYRIEADARRVSENPDLGFRFKIRGDDEFHDVERSLNKMMESFERRYVQKERS